MQLPAGKASSGPAAPFLYRDIHAPTDLVPSLARVLHSSRELILLTTNAKQYDLAVNLIANLASMGMDNYLLLADNADLVMHAARRGAVAAVWSSLLDSYTMRPNSGNCPSGCRDGDARESILSRRPPRPSECRMAPASCPVAPVTFYRADTVRRLWLLRFHYAARLLEHQYGVLLLDSDSIVLANPYPLIRRHLGEYAAIGLEDLSAWPQMTVNGGTWYLRAAPAGPVHSLVASVLTRARRVLDAYPAAVSYDADPRARRGKPADFLCFDQTLINLALLSWLIG